MNLAAVHLGMAVSDDGQREAHMADAAEHCQRALEVYRPDEHPIGWAKVQMSLADVYVLRGEAGDPEQLRNAARGFELGLEVFRLAGLSCEARRACLALADIYGRQGWWDHAARVYQAGIDAGETMYEGSLLRESRNVEIESTRPLVTGAVLALARAGRATDALLTFERGRARWLGDALATDRHDVERLRGEHREVLDAFEAAVDRCSKRLTRPGGSSRRLSTEFESSQASKTSFALPGSRRSRSS
jgi:hypothetical protein